MARKAPTSDKLTPANLDKIIALLGQEKPITKKLACEIIGITYNTTRLESLIEAHKAKKLHEREQRDKKRGKPASIEEIQLIISSYLEGEPVSTIAKRIYRGDVFVSNILEKYGCPRRALSADYFKPELIPDNSVSETFALKEKVWAARYNSVATIMAVNANNQPGIYKIWLEAEEWQQFAFQPWWELGSLKQLTNIGVTI